MRCSLSHEHFPLWTCLIGTELVSVKTIINKHLLFVLFFLPCGALLAGIHGQSVLLLLLFLLLFSSFFFFLLFFSSVILLVVTILFFWESSHCFSGHQQCPGGVSILLDIPIASHRISPTTPPNYLPASSSPSISLHPIKPPNSYTIHHSFYFIILLYFSIH